MSKNNDIVNSPFLHQSYLRLLRNDYYSYLQKAFHTLNPSTEFVGNWHLQAICEYLQAMQNGEIKKLIVNIPPRSLKSITITVGWSSFLLGHNPSSKIISASYSQAISLKHSSDARNLINSSWHRQAFPELQIQKGQNEKYKFATDKHGFRLATSIDGSLTGEGGDIIIIDDPQNPLQAASETSRNHTKQWYDKTLSSRLNNKNTGLILLVMQRLHPDDLSGHLLERGGFEFLCLPAIADKAISINIGSINKIMCSGELLQPLRENKLILNQLKRDLGTAAFNAQYMQQPINEDGGIIKREWIRYITELPNIDKDFTIIQSWDTAIKTGKNNDKSACVTILYFKGDYIITDILASRIDFPDLCNITISQYHKFKPDVILIEDKASGQSLIQEMRVNSELPIIAIMPKGDKLQRVARITPILEAGRVKFLKSKNNDEMEAELLGFPNSRHDDILDALSQGLNWLMHKQQNKNQHRLRIL